MAQVVKRVCNEAIFEGLRSFFCELCQHIIERKIKKEQVWNMDDTGFIERKNKRKVVLSKGYINVWSNCADANFHMTFSVCVSATKYVSPPLLVLSGKWLNRDFLGGCDIEDANITTAPKRFYKL